jgi:hypothetical protein
MRRGCLVLMAPLSLACGGDVANDGGSGNGGASGARDGGAASTSGGAAGVSGGGTAGATSGGTSGASSGGAAGASSGGAGGAGQAGAGGGSAGSAGAGGIPGDVGSGQCQDFTPCGGDLTGIWTYMACTDPQPSIQSLYCNDIDENVTVRGEIEFRADGTATASGFIQSRATLGANCSCGLPAGFLFECTPGANQTCVCDSTDNQTSVSTYTTSGNLLINARNNGPGYLHYCREADEVWMRGVNAQGMIFVYQLTPR